MHFRKFLVSEVDSEEKISAFLSEYGDTLTPDKLFPIGDYFCGYFDDASDEEKQKKAIVHQLKRDLIQLEVQYIQRERKLKSAKTDAQKLEAKDEIETLENQIQFTKDKLEEIDV